MSYRFFAVVSLAMLAVACVPGEPRRISLLDVPETWDEQALAGLEVPLPSPEHSAAHVDADYYYAIRPRQVYRSYSVYHPDHEPEGYWEWLQQQEPEVVFDPSAYETEEDWIAAGKLVFEEGAIYSTGSDLATTRDPGLYEAVDIPLSEGGVIPYIRYFVREPGVVELGTASCATCHTRVMDDGTVIHGAQGNFPLSNAFAYQLRQFAAPQDPAEAEVPLALTSMISMRFGAPWIDPDPAAQFQGRSLADVASALDAQIPGIQSRERSSLLTPIRIPDLIGIRDRLYLDATGLVQHRSIADLMRYSALNQGADLLSSFGGFIPLTLDGSSRPDPGHPMLSRYTDAQLYALALYLYDLEPPPNPNPFDASARRGQDVFEDLDCGRCHTPPLYTNNTLTPAVGFEPPPEAYETLQITDTHVGTDPALTLGTRRGTGYYKVPSLKGLWYRSPLLHDGSVASLEDLFDPMRLGDDYVPTGYRPPGTETRGVRGHRFGLSMSETEKKDLIAFLRTL